MKVKTKNLIGAALDWAVATILDYSHLRVNPLKRNNGFVMDPPRVEYGPVHLSDISSSTDWAVGGPIIERLTGFELKIWLESSDNTECEAHIHNLDGNWIMFGPTPLVAAMRCYVASKLGNEVEIPEDLL